MKSPSNLNYDEKIVRRIDTPEPLFISIYYFKLFKSCLVSEICDLENIYQSLSA